MSFEVKLAQTFVKTPLGKEVKEFVLLLSGKEIARRVARIATEKLAPAVSAAAIHIAAAIAEEALRIWPKYLAKYPFLEKVGKEAFAETVARLLARGKEDLRAIRGVIVERFIPSMPELKNLMATLETRVTKGWSTPFLLSGARTLDNAEIADWLIVSQHEDGRIWIMAIIESKSISNTKDLALTRGRGTGQFLWDYIRLKSEGIRLEWDGVVHEFAPDKIEVHPVPLGAPPPAHGLTTDLIAVAPRDFTQGELNKLSLQRVKVTAWRWPVDEDELAHLIRDLVKQFQ